MVATPVSCNTAMELSKAFHHVTRTRIGSPYVIEAMEVALARGQQSVVGFEANGGFLLGDCIALDGRVLEALPTRDAILPMLALLHSSVMQGKPLSQLVNGLPQRFTASDRLQNFAPDKSKILISQLIVSDLAVQELLGNFCGELLERNTIDGLRMTFSSGEIVHLRPSGNAPELRCYAEADTEEKAIKLVRNMLQIISKLIL